MYNVLDVSRYIINYSNRKDYDISNLKLQKLLYFVQAFFLVFTLSGEECFPEEIEAWDFGPVVPEAYREYKQCGSGNIPPISSYIEFNNDNIFHSKKEDYTEECIKKSDRILINDVVDAFADYTATDLVELTHAQSPWQDAYVRHQNNIITKESIRGYFNGKRD